MKRSLALAIPSFDALAESAQTLERLDFHRAWATELRTRDAVVRALEIGSETSSLNVGTGIAYAFTRHPLAMAAAAIEANEAVGGRFALGIGVGTAHTRHEYGLEFDHPAPRLAEYIALIRAAIEADGSLDFEGRFYNVRMPGFRYAESQASRETLRLYGSALNPVALKAIAKSCDGVALHPFGHVGAYLEQVVLPSLDAGSSSVGRSRPIIASWMIACALDDGERARDLSRAQIALYAAQPAFAPYFAYTDWAAAAESIRDSVDLSRGPQNWLEVGRAAVNDDMLDGLAAAGTPEQVAARIVEKEAELAGYGVDELTFQLPGVALPEAEGLEALKQLALAASSSRNVIVA